MAQTDLDVRRAEISALADGVVTLERDLRAQGAEVFDYFDRAEAMDIIDRIERRILANMPVDTAAEAAE